MDSLACLCGKHRFTNRRYAFEYKTGHQRDRLAVVVVVRIINAGTKICMVPCWHD